MENDVDKTETRQGYTPHMTRYVLFIGVPAVIIGFAIAALWVF